VLPGIPQFFPTANPLSLLPQASFAGGTTGTTGSFGYEQRFGFYGYNTLFNVSGNLTKLKGAHNMKTGIFVEHTTRPAQRSSAFNGTISFDANGAGASNPANANVGFANALLGTITQYQESNAHPSAHGEFMNTEFYAQDNWRVKRNFTVDAGVRFYAITPTQSQGDKVAAFEPTQWTASKAPLLYQPTLVGTSRMAKNPLTGEVLPAVYIGRLVPNSGDFINGTVVGCHRRQQDCDSRRRRSLLRPVLRRQHSRPDRAAAAASDLHDQLHHHSGTARQPAYCDADGSASNRRPHPSAGRLQLEPGGSA
jgi:hypothetical protein